MIRRAFPGDGRVRLVFTIANKLVFWGLAASGLQANLEECYISGLCGLDRANSDKLCGGDCGYQSLG